MNNIATIFFKEFKSYFLSPIAYIVLSVYLILTNFLFFQSFFVINQAEMRNYFSILPWVFLIFIPAVTMRLWSEEKKEKTLELMLTWPVKEVELVTAKFLGAVAFLFIAFLLSITIPITIALLGDPDEGVILASYIGAALLGCAYISIGLFCSSLTENQIIAFLLGAAVSFVLFIVGTPFVTMFAPSSVTPFLMYLGLGQHFDNIIKGVIDSRDVIYYLSVIGFFLFLNIHSLESRKWE